VVIKKSDYKEKSAGQKHSAGVVLIPEHERRRPARPCRQHVEPTVNPDPPIGKVTNQVFVDK
jgi:hypothetical protein